MIMVGSRVVFVFVFVVFMNDDDPPSPVRSAKLHRAHGLLLVIDS